MPDRPLLILPAPSEPEQRAKKGGGSPKLHLPSRAKQSERLAPRFETLQQAMDSRRAQMRTDAAGLAPEEVIVLETVAPVEHFIAAVRKIKGLEWLGEIENEDIPPDDDFFLIDKNGARKDGSFRGRVFLVFSNQQALQQVLSLWRSWSSDKSLPHGLKAWGSVFLLLRDVRPWGVRDRLLETGVLADWRERVEHNDEIIPCEVELWFRGDPMQRRAGRDRVAGMVDALGGQILQEAAIEEIAYHALLAHLPAAAVQPLLDEAGQDTELVQCEQIQFFRASGQMAGIVVGSERSEDPSPSSAVAELLAEPVVALFDGLPLQNHRRLSNRLLIDDPDGIEAQYPAFERIHGTAMASLILHGELDAGEAPLSRRLYVRPILRPDPHMWKSPRPETVSEDVLVVDLVHRAVRRLFEGEGSQPAVARQICVVNMSIGIRDRLFDSVLSPLARLLDWLAWSYNILFIVSAGNHFHSIELPLPRAQARELAPPDLQAAVVRAVAADARHRRLLSPAEAVNALTIGALHQDASNGSMQQDSRFPFLGQGLPSVVSAQGMGYRRAIKPDAFLPGGRVTVRESMRVTPRALLEVLGQARPPGQRVATPGPTAGDLSSTCHIRGTSNAAALASRSASELYDILQELRTHSGGDLIDQVPFATWLKTLLVHGASWGGAGEILEDLLAPDHSPRQFKEYVTRLLGYGAVDSSRVREGTPCRVTALGGGVLTADQAHIHRFPLPPSLSGRTGWRRLTLTLAWITPVNTSHHGWRRAALWFTSPADPLALTRQQAQWQAVQRGTVQHEVFEGDRAAAFVDGASLEILVNCRADAGTLEDSIPYALAMTLEVAEEIGVDIFNEVRVRVLAGRIQVASGSP